MPSRHTAISKATRQLFATLLAAGEEYSVGQRSLAHRLDQIPGRGSRRHAEHFETGDEGTIRCALADRNTAPPLPRSRANSENAKEVVDGGWAGPGHAVLLRFAIEGPQDFSVGVDALQFDDGFGQDG